MIAVKTDRETPYPIIDIELIRQACCLDSAIEGERRRRHAMVESFDEQKDFAFSHNIARDGEPKHTEYWCDRCVGWFGVSHGGGYELKRTVINPEEWVFQVEDHNGFWSRGHCSGRGRTPWFGAEARCACLGCQVIAEWRKITQGTVDAIKNKTATGPWSTTPLPHGLTFNTDAPLVAWRCTGQFEFEAIFAIDGPDGAVTRLTSFLMPDDAKTEYQLR